MQDVSPATLAEWRGVGLGQRWHRVLIDQGDGFVDVPFTGYQITAKRGERQVCRYNGTANLSPGAPTINPYVDKVRLQAGFLIAGTVEWTTITTARVEDVEADEAGAQSLTLFSLERAVEVAGFDGPTQLQSRTCVDAIVELLSIVDAPVSVLIGSDAQVPISIFDSSASRWDAVQKYAQAITADVYADPFGGFVISPSPTLADEPVLTIDAGGVKISHRRKLSRTGVPSVVVVEGNRTDTSSLPPRGVWRDDNPFSPTYWLGPFGQQIKVVNSPIMLTNEQCAKAAATIGAQSQGLARTLAVETIPADFLLPGDVVRVEFEDGTAETHIVDGLGHTSVDSNQALETRTTEG